MIEEILTPFEFRNMNKNNRRSINEKRDGNYTYGCIMACVDKDIQHPDLNMDDVYYGEDNDKGIEDEHHVTLLFGLHNDIIYDDVIMFLQNIKMPLLQLTGISTFNNPEFDVVKYDVKCPEFHLYNKLIKLQFPYTSNFPEYVPHMTISYMKPGTGDVYKEEFKESTVLQVSKWIYSESNKKKTAIYPDGKVIVIRDAQK